MIELSALGFILASIIVGVVGFTFRTIVGILFKKSTKRAI